MGDFYEYWEILPEYNKYETIGQEIVRYKRNLQDAEVTSMDLSENVIEFLKEKLLESPYPTNNIINHIIDSNDPEKNQLLEEIIINTLIKLIDLIIEHPEQMDKKFKLFNLLSNIFISDNKIHKMHSVIIPALFDLKENRQYLDYVLYLSMLSRNSLSMLRQYLEYEHNHLMERFDERTIFLRCYYQKKHWIDYILLNHANDEGIRGFFNESFYQNLTLCKMILSHDDTCDKQVLTEINPSVIENNFLQLCLLELSRHEKLMNFLTQHSDNIVTVDTTKSHIMTQLLRLKIPFNMNHYDAILELLKFNFENNLKQLEKLHNSTETYVGRTEMQLFNEYMVIKLYLLKILQKNAGDESCINHIRHLLKTINDGRVLFDIMQTVLFMIFMRYEHIRKTKLRQRSMDESGSRNNINSTETSDSIFVDSFNNHGFICSKESLGMILNSMRFFLMSLDITEAYKNCDDELKKKFSSLLKIVDIGLWRLQVIESNCTSEEVKSVNFSKELLASYDDVSKFISPPEKTSNDMRMNRKMPKKRLRKRSKASVPSEKSSNEENHSDEKTLDTTFTTDHSKKSSNRVKLQEEIKPENFISKMLMKPESLIVICSRNNDNETIQRIIKDYDLKGTLIEREIEFINNYQSTLKQLRSIALKYDEICEREKSLNSVGEIKDLAEAGFEVARFMDTVEKYCLQNNFKHIDQDDSFLDKIIEQFPNLQLYKKPNVIVTSVMDFMITLPNNLELTNSLAKFIVKKYNFRDSRKGNYFVTFLKRIMEILSAFKAQEFSLTKLMNEEIFSLDPIAFKAQMENRENFKKCLEMKTEALNEESTLQDLLPKLGNFHSDINYFKRIYSYVVNLRHMAKFETNEYFTVNNVIKELNVYDLIGQIVFIHQYNPELLEIHAFNANINLFHAIAIAAGTEFLPPSIKKSVKNGEKIANLMEVRNVEKKKLKYFNISNTNILYYLKKSGSFLVAYLIKEIQDFHYPNLKYDEPNFFERLKNIDSVQNLKDLYRGNVVLTALNSDYIEMKMIMDRISKLDEKGKLNLLSHVNERTVDRNKSKFDELKDSYIETLMSQKNANVESLLMKIGNIHKFNELLLKHIKEIKSDKDLESLLTWSLSAKNRGSLTETEREELEKWLEKIKIYRQVLTLFQKVNIEGYENITWMNILELAEQNTSVLINFLINISTDLELCNQLLRLHPLQSKNEEIYRIFIAALNKEKFNQQHETLFRIIQNYSSKFLIDFFDYSLDYIHNMKSMKFILSYLLSHDVTPKNHIRYQKFEISCTIIDYLDATDMQLWSLAAFPLILLEQLLMNSKIEILNNIVPVLRKLLTIQPSCNLCKTTSTNYQVGEVIVYDYDAYHRGFRISNDCLDFLFKIYAAKALDFQIIDIQLQSNPSTHSGNQSADAIQIHQIPKEVPSRENWVPDNEAVFCMCCRKSKFSLLNRRHHCRRCGNVVCGECSRQRILLPEKYSNLMVRCCDDCFSQLEIKKRRSDFSPSDRSNRSADMPIEWKLTGNIETDQMIRDEFAFEFSPNVGRCIAIIRLHTINEEFTNFLLFHCHRLELLLHPINGRLNPEIDIVLVGSMLKYLAKTAKLFGDIGESNAIIDQIDIILKIAENDCDSILSKASFNVITNNLSIRDIINELIKVENWKLALELSVKWDRNSTSGVFSAWSVSLIRGGFYRLAREKMSLALQPVSGSSSKVNEDFIAALASDASLDGFSFSYKRLTKSSPLLCEILDIIDTVIPKNIPQQKSGSPIRENLAKTDVGSMEYLRKIIDGDYGGSPKKKTNSFDVSHSDLLKSPYYEESMYYLVSYGGNVDILDFLMKNNLIKFAIRYALIQKISYDLFIQFIFLPVIRSGHIKDFMTILKEIDADYKRSKNYIISLCKYLDRKKSFHVLYQVQLLIDDNIRAALTSLKFYLDGSGNYTELNEKSRHLIDAKNHLQLELERVENSINITRNEIQLKWDIKSINAQINIILLQLEVAKYLANCELSGYPTLDLMPKVFLDRISLKTLLGKPNEKSQVAILLLICGHSIESSFGLSYRIIQECSLKSFKIYSTCTKYLAHDLKRLIEVEKLINCIKTNASCGESNSIDPETEKMCDDLICMAVEIAHAQHSSEAKIQIDQLIKLISSKTMKIQCYINSNQLKTAFVHSAALNNVDYIKRIMKQAEITRQENIRRLCEKKLQQSMCSSMSESENMSESTSGSFHK